MVTQIKTDPSYNVFIEEPTAIRVNMGIQWFLGVAIVLPSGAFDAESALTHEIGHFLGLGNVASSCINAIMIEDIMRAEVRRGLSESDMKGLLLIYGAPCRPISPTYVAETVIRGPGDVIVTGPFQLLSLDIPGSAAVIRQENGVPNNAFPVRAPLNIPSGWVTATDINSTGMYTVRYTGCKN